MAIPPPSDNTYGLGDPNQIAAQLAAAMAGSGTASILGQAAAGVGGGTPFDQWVQQFHMHAAAVDANTRLSTLSGYGTQANPELPVYMGHGHIPGVPAHIGAAYDPETHGKTGVVTKGKPPKGADKVTTVDGAMALPATWSTEEVASMIKKMQSLGFTNVKNYDDMMNVWQSAVQRASQTYLATGGQTKLTPWDALNLYGQENTADSNTPGSANFTGERTQVSRSVTDISEGQAWAAMHQQLQGMLGRDPSDQEVRDFTYRMQALAARNPNISKTVQQYKDGQLVDTSTHNNAGFTGDDIDHALYEQAQADPDYGAYQAASTYYNAALSALGPIGGA